MSHPDIDRCLGDVRAAVRATSDDDVFAALYPSLRRFAAAIRPAEVDADDLVQEALARVLATGSLAALEDAAAYLRTTMVRLVSNERRSLGRRRRALTRLAPSEAEVPAYPSDLDDLRRLPPLDRAVLYLTVVEHVPYSEVARQLGCSEEAARKRASRAIRKLRRTLAPERSGGE